MKRSGSLAGAVSPPPLKRKVEPTATSETNPTYQYLFLYIYSLTTLFPKIESSVASFFTPTSQKKPEKVSWRIVNKSLIVGKYASDPSASEKLDSTRRRRVAAFDFVRFYHKISIVFVC